MVLSTEPIEQKILDAAREDGLRVLELDIAGPPTAELLRA